jgi:hypothetical protein
METAQFPTRFRSRVQSVLIVIAILVLGFFLRTINVNWDEDQHLHPDERFLTMVMGSMTVPQNLGHYLDPASSPFNPTNIGYSFYVYGAFPLIVNKVFALTFQTDEYKMLNIQGRVSSAVMDATMILVLVLIVQQFEKRYGFSRNLKYFAGLLYALCVFAIQQSHFFTVDTFANTFFFLSLLWAIKIDTKHFIRKSVLSGVLMGLALASKINVVLGAPLIGWFVIDRFVVEYFFYKKYRQFLACVIFTSLFWFISCWIVLRFANPYYFERFSLIDWHLNEQFLKSIQSLQSLNDPTGYFPPGIQWVSKLPIVFPFMNIAVWGLGLPLFFFSVFGWGKMIIYALSDWKKRIGLLMIFFWMVAFFVFQGTQYVTTMRYFYVLYPFSVMGAAYGIYEFGRHTVQKKSLKPRHHEWIIAVCTLLCFVWPLMFISVYLHRNTRLAASAWMYRVMPDETMVALEHWDDPLPLLGEDLNPEGKLISGEQLPIFYEDTEEKWQEMQAILERTDYYVLTSNRGWASIIMAPEKYPQMSIFYEELFDGRTEFEKIAEFTSYPSLRYLGIPITINDDWAEEAFTVYDHPKVMIYAKKK